MSAALWAIGGLWRDRQLTASTNLHSRDTFLPTCDQAVQWELHGLSTVPGGVKLFAGFEVNAHVVDLDDTTRLGVCGLAGVGCDLLTNPGLLAAVRADFDRGIREQDEKGV